MSQHNFKKGLPSLPFGLPADQPTVKDGKTPKTKSLRELIVEKLEAHQRTKGRRDIFIDNMIRELRLN